jgi:hypothetical protein
MGIIVTHVDLCAQTMAKTHTLRVDENRTNEQGVRGAHLRAIAPVGSQAASTKQHAHICNDDVRGSDAYVQYNSARDCLNTV